MHRKWLGRACFGWWLHFAGGSEKWRMGMISRISDFLGRSLQMGLSVVVQCPLHAHYFTIFIQVSLLSLLSVLSCLVARQLSSLFTLPSF